MQRQLSTMRTAMMVLQILILCLLSLPGLPIAFAAQWSQNLSTDVWQPPLAGPDQVVTVYATVAFNKLSNLDGVQY